MSLTPKQESLIKAAKAGMTDKEYLSFQEMQEMNDTLTEANTILRQLVEREDKPQEVRVTLKIT